MKKSFIFLLAVCALALSGTAAFATPSTQIWIPSTDIQPGLIHFGIDNYLKVKPATISGYELWEPTVSNVGITLGKKKFGSFEKIGVELGFDYRKTGFGAYSASQKIVALGTTAGSNNVKELKNAAAGNSPDDSPYLLNAKVALLDGAFGPYVPAIAIGIYDLGFKEGYTDNDIAYALVAHSVPFIGGRFSLGYYAGLGKSVYLKDGDSADDKSGLLISYDAKPFDLWWWGVDYQGAKNSYGALSFGLGLPMTDKIGLLVGYNIYNQNSDKVKPTLTLQLDIDMGVPDAVTPVTDTPPMEPTGDPSVAPAPDGTVPAPDGSVAPAPTTPETATPAPIPATPTPEVAPAPVAPEVTSPPVAPAPVVTPAPSVATPEPAPAPAPSEATTAPAPVVIPAPAPSVVAPSEPAPSAPPPAATPSPAPQVPPAATPAPAPAPTPAPESTPTAPASPAPAK